MSIANVQPIPVLNPLYLATEYTLRKNLNVYLFLCDYLNLSAQQTNYMTRSRDNWEAHDDRQAQQWGPGTISERFWNTLNNDLKWRYQTSNGSFRIVK